MKALSAFAGQYIRKQYSGAGGGDTDDSEKKTAPLFAVTFLAFY
ncbi:hypothetical protein [Candidatus Pantoea soli]|nr:hypothetical protein [Pantoea soli]